MMDIKEAFGAYEQLLLKWNKTHNLGGNLDSALIESYIKESVYPLDFLPSFHRCIDVGSGAGFPAIPLAIKCKDAHFILIEPRKKRCAFLQMVCAQLGLKNVEIIPRRMEEVELGYEDRADIITSRALMNTRDLMDKTRHLLKNTGAFLFYKGSELGNEIDCDVSKFRRLDQRIFFYHQLEE